MTSIEEGRAEVKSYGFHRSNHRSAVLLDGADAARRTGE
jgi:hypothetical protein